MRYVAFVISLAMVSVPARAEVLSWQGVGPVQLGMTVKAAEQALGTKLEPRSLVYTSEECYETWRTDKKELGIGYVVEKGRITVIQVYRRDGQSPDVRDKNGVGIGSTEDDIEHAYRQVKKSPGFYDRGESKDDSVEPQRERETGASAAEYVPEVWIEAESPGNKMHAILFITQAGKITSMTTGFKPMVLEPEPCL